MAGTGCPAETLDGGKLLADACLNRELFTGLETLAWFRESRAGISQNRVVALQGQHHQRNSRFVCWVQCTDCSSVGVGTS